MGIGYPRLDRMNEKVWLVVLLRPAAQKVGRRADLSATQKRNDNRAE